MAAFFQGKEAYEKPDLLSVKVPTCQACRVLFCLLGQKGLKDESNREHDFPQIEHGKCFCQ
jgi:hypothetical protein